jgi:ribosomal-protein-alanine N-acetyltransferase
VGAGAVTVRPAAARDLDAVVAIERASFGDPWSRESFESAIADRNLRFEVAAAPAGEVAGYIVYWLAGGEGELANIAVAPARRRDGIGALLLHAVLTVARTAGTGFVHLEVRESNMAARALYARFGFAEVGRRRAYYRQPVEDALMLRCQLGVARGIGDARG